ncbi:hypothetical protein [uncultured Shewanella sp.]|uniref:hypothetical protein n=1 Tax=uncultured Shewanella sp. TaxID=173975 RepID=UPI00260B8EEE|nr:hypothetical protein [uncultured Shewanella sp.]
MPAFSNIKNIFRSNTVQDNTIKPLDSDTLSWFDNTNHIQNTFKKNAKWSLIRSLCTPKGIGRSMRAIIPCPMVKKAISACTVKVCDMKRASHDGILPSPKFVSIPMGGWEKLSPKPQIGDKALAKDYLRYAAAMDYVGKPKNYQAVSSSRALSSDVIDQSSQGWQYKAVNQLNLSRSPIISRFFSALPEAVRNGLDDSGTFKDKRTGNVISLLFDEKRNELVVCHGGTACGFDGANGKKLLQSQVIGNMSNWCGAIPPSVEQAIAFGKVVKHTVEKMNKGLLEKSHLKMTHVGHSRGGLMAQASALANECKGVCSNAEPMGAGVQRLVGMAYNQIKPQGTEVIQFNHRHDSLSTHSYMKGFGQGVIKHTLGWNVPLNAGETFRMAGRGGFDKLDIRAHECPYAQMLYAATHEYKEIETKDTQWEIDRVMKGSVSYI